MSLQFDVRLPRRDFDLALAGGFSRETVGVFGPSGAGKSSLFRVLAGLERPERGRIVLNERVLVDTAAGVYVPPQRRRIGIVFQDLLLFPHLSVRGNLEFGVRYARGSRVPFDAVVELLDLAPILDASPADVSGGEQQRTAIGRALLASPELLLLDEPFSAVDVSLRAAILPYLRRLRDDLDVPMLVISHDLSDIQRLTDRVYLVERGQCTGHGTVLDLFGTGTLPAAGDGLLNTFRLRVVGHDGRLGLDDCVVVGAPGVRLRVPPAGSEEVTLVVKPSEVAIARRPVDGISIQNQLTGTIGRMVERNGAVFCVVDTGVPVVAQVSRAAVAELRLEPGLAVTCLFKAHSLTR